MQFLGTRDCPVVPVLPAADLSPPVSRIADRHGSYANRIRTSLRPVDPGLSYSTVLVTTRPYYRMIRSSVSARHLSVRQWDYFAGRGQAVAWHIRAHDEPVVIWSGDETDREEGA